MASPPQTESAHKTEGRSLFRTLIATAADGIIVIDAQGIVQVFNAACEALFGYAPREVIGRNVKVLMPAPYHDEHDGYLSHYRTTGEKRIIGIGREVVGRRKDGSTFPMYLSVGEGAIDGAPIFVGIIHDLTQRKKADDALHEREARLSQLQSELLHVSRLSAMGQMASALAHELNQPLTAIANYMNAAKRTIGATDDPKIQRAQELMEKAAQQTLRAGTIIRNLREFIEKRETDRAHENLNKVVEEAIALGLAGSADANVRIRVDLDPRLPAVLIDKIQIEQVLINLIRNSIEAMQGMDRRELTIVTKPDEAGFAEIAVSDTGPGLPPEVSSRLFHPFVTTKEKGMGIGLTICQSIVESHGGRIWASPNPEGGVAISLPAAVDERDQGITTVKATVFVVDDDADVRASVRALLEAESLPVETYESAVAFLAEGAFGRGCVVADIRMPDMDGLELQQELTRRQIGLPVIIVTGHGDVALAVRAMKAGAVDFIEKPFDADLLLDSIRRALETGERTQARASEAKAAAAAISQLTAREREVLEHLIARQPNKVIAYELGISPRTVEIHRARVMEKLKAHSLSDLVRLGLAAGLATRTGNP